MIQIQNEDELGIILSGATTREATCQLLESAEGGLEEGMLVLVLSQGRQILARISQIFPYNAFYTEGDAWSEARRKDLKIPGEIARQYEICKLDLLIELPQGEIKYPPMPGDYITKIDPKKHEKKIYGIDREEPGYCWYGTLSGYKEAPVPLDVEKIPMHMAVFGTTGSGKSFDTGNLIEKLMRIRVDNMSSVSFPMIIIDANGDYLDYYEHFKKNEEFLNVGWIKRFVFPHVEMENPKLHGEDVIGIDLDALSIREVAETIMMYYRGTLEGAELQLSGIVNLLEYMRDEKAYDSMHDLFCDDENYTELKEELGKIDTKIIHRQTKDAIIRSFEKFREIERNYGVLSAKSHSELTNENFIDEITRGGGVAIIDFSEEGATGVEIQVKQLVMTYLATRLFNEFTEYKIRENGRYLIFLIEEAQNFVPDKSYPVGSTLAKNKLSLIATQGRKFGLSLCLITQRPSFLDRIVLSMCNTFLIHRISPEDVSYVKNVTGGLPASLANRLTRLTQGELILTGQMNKLPFPLLIKVPEEDRIVEHTAGTTNVIDRLSKLRGVKS
ncbi:predicted ATPase [Methanothermobacter sp. MT-2]|nr:predicted ATPase [Methanothermobacter sp. MT-2]HHW05108.1 ATP-binding protein [Methanothermobacter sp.]HPU36904.1 ATP-binding protein [Methanothermobacter sp.]